MLGVALTSCAGLLNTQKTPFQGEEAVALEDVLAIAGTELFANSAAQTFKPVGARNAAGSEVSRGAAGEIAAGDILHNLLSINDHDILAV